MSTARVVDNEGEALQLVQQAGFNAARTVILNRNADANSVQESNGTFMGVAQVTSEEPESIQLRATCPQRCYLVMAKIYYPGWRATVNGQSKPVLRANYAFSAVKLGPGDNAVTYFYDPLPFKLGLALTLVSLTISLLLVLLCLIRAEHTSV